MTACQNATSNPSPETIASADVTAAFALTEIFVNSKGHGGRRRYVLERINGELVLRQTEFDAAIEAAFEVSCSDRENGVCRRVVKLP